MAKINEIGLSTKLNLRSKKPLSGITHRKVKKSIGANVSAKTSSLYCKRKIGGLSGLLLMSFWCLPKMASVPI